MGPCRGWCRGGAGEFDQIALTPLGIGGGPPNLYLSRCSHRLVRGDGPTEVLGPEGWSKYLAAAARKTRAAQKHDPWRFEPPALSRRGSVLCCRDVEPVLKRTTEVIRLPGGICGDRGAMEMEIAEQSGGWVYRRQEQRDIWGSTDMDTRLENPSLAHMWAEWWADSPVLSGIRKNYLGVGKERSDILGGGSGVGL